MLKSLPLKTVVLLVAPSYNGKSTLAQRSVDYIRQHKDLGTYSTATVISSDTIRRELVGDASMDRLDQRMMQVSNQAFDVLENRLKNHMTWPSSTDIIFVDTTGLDPRFRSKIKNYAGKYNYNTAIVYTNFKDNDDYFRYNPVDFQREVTSKHIGKLTKSLKDITSESYDVVFRVKSGEEFDELTFVPDIKELKQRVNNTLEMQDSDEYFIIGDIHGCYNQMIQILEDAGFVINDGMISDTEGKGKTTRVISVGDLVDKGPDVDKVISFVYDNNHIFDIVLGNHDKWVYRYLIGDLTNVEDHKYLFDSIDMFETNVSARSKFFSVIERSHLYLRHRDFIVTHTPAGKKYLEKFGRRGKKQTQLRYPKRSDYETDQDYQTAYSEFFQPIQDEAQWCEPRRIFGHIPQEFPKPYGNLIPVDGGCVSGHRLTAYAIDNNRRTRYYSVVNTEVSKEELPPPIFAKKQRDIEGLWNTLEPREKGRVGWLAQRNANFLSGTMSPADKLGDDLESLEAGIQYYKSKGINKLILEPKYMGSRANVYIVYNEDGTVNVQESYILSRSGYKVDRLSAEEQTQLDKSILSIGQRLKNHFTNAKVIVLDAELMPWAALGKGLIEHQFLPSMVGAGTTADSLHETGFEKVLSDLRNDPIYQNFKEDWGELSKSKLKKKYGHSDYSRYFALMNYMNIHANHKQVTEEIEVFKDQMETHGSDATVDLKPFAVLKVVYHDDEKEDDVVFSTLTTSDQWRIASGYKIVEDDSNFKFHPGFYALCIDLSDDKLEDSIELATKYFQAIEKYNMEGVVLKPDTPFNPTKTIAPYLKVRNKKYLTLVYGLDYLRDKKYEKLMKKKSIKRKVAISIEEMRLGINMLNIPYDSISEENEAWRDLMAAFITEETKERSLDPRL